MSLLKFVEIWKTILPCIVSMKPHSDLCFTYQDNNNLIIKSSNENIGNKHVALNKQLQHLHRAQIQQSDISIQSKIC